MVATSTLSLSFALPEGARSWGALVRGAPSFVRRSNQYVDRKSDPSPRRGVTTGRGRIALSIREVRALGAGRAPRWSRLPTWSRLPVGRGPLGGHLRLDRR